jgi:hypothetical protein
LRVLVGGEARKGKSSDVVQMETEDVDTRAKWSV